MIVRCECGHVNPVGTIICEACGRTLANHKMKTNYWICAMKAVPRRSQTYNKSIIDKIWNFFSSVKVGVSLIVIALVASAIGTIFPQEAYIPSTIPAFRVLSTRIWYAWEAILYTWIS